MSDQQKSKAAQLAEQGQRLTVELWHDPEGNGWSTIEVDGHLEHYRITNKAFRRWLRAAYYRDTGGSTSRQSENDAVNLLEAVACHAGERHPVFTRIAEVNGAVWIDLCDDDWTVVEVTAEGWRAVPQSPVRFRRTKGMLALPMPRRDGDLELLRGYLNVRGEDDWRLLLALLTCYLRATGPYPVCSLRGEQGTAKSTAGRVLKRLIDPNTAPLRAEPREVRDLSIAAKNGWLLVYDNLSGLAPWLSDALSRLSTGGGFATRELYSDDEEVLFDGQRPIVLTGIADVVDKGDLRQRTVDIDLPPIPDVRRRPEKRFWAAFERDLPSIFGALLDALAGVVREESNVPEQALGWPRMADFAVRGVALERALGWPEGSFLAAYRGNRAGAREVALDDSLVAGLVRTIAADGAFTGTASELLARLETMVVPEVLKTRAWPKQPHILSGNLRLIANDLRAEGWADVDFSRSHRPRTITISPVERAGKTSVPSVPSVPRPNPGLGGRSEAGRSRVAGDAGTLGNDAGRDARPRSVSSSGDARDAGDARIPTRSSSRVRVWTNKFPDGWHLVDGSGCEVVNDEGEEVGAFSTREAAVVWAEKHDMEVVK